MCTNFEINSVSNNGGKIRGSELGKLSISVETFWDMLFNKLVAQTEGSQKILKNKRENSSTLQELSILYAQICCENCPERVKGTPNL